MKLLETAGGGRWPWFGRCGMEAGCSPSTVAGDSCTRQGSPTAALRRQTLHRPLGVEIEGEGGYVDTRER